MKIILSPSKLQKSHHILGLPLVDRCYDQKTALLEDWMTQLRAQRGSSLTDGIGKALGASSTDNVLGHAIASYTGIVFKELDWRSFEAPQWDYAEAHLRILSAYFGVLTPMTAMYPYRLDFGARLPGIQLYSHWREEILESFKTSDIVVNLASKEYSQMLDRKRFKGKILDVDFKEEQFDGSLKVVTVHAKQARGLMAQYMVMGLVEDVTRLKAFDGAGYRFEPSLSTDLHYVFVKFL